MYPDIGGYRQLLRIEESFRINKHDLKMRPIFHWKPERIKAHISICYLAFALGKFSIEKMKSQGLQLSFDKLRTELSEIESSILMDQSGNGKQLYLPAITIECKPGSHLIQNITLY